jgi:Lrp/AsnC family transcriptional regulator for asnA, asnC and gidA
VTSFGRFNIVIGIQYPNWDGVLNFISSELSETTGIYEIQTFFVKDIKKRYYGFEETSYNGQAPAKIDGTDLKLINELAENGRYSGIYLSNKLGISLSAASKRLATLFREDVVKIRAMSNPSKIGFHSNAYLFIHAERNRVKEICNRLYPHNEISTLLTLSNGYDIYASIIARTPQALYDFVKVKVAPIRGITGMETLIRGELIKRYYGSFHLDEQNLAMVSNFEPLP